MSEKKNKKEDEVIDENIAEEVKNKDNTSEETINKEETVELEETEAYKSADFKEKLSLKFRKRLISNGFHTAVLIIFLIVIFFGVNIWANSKNLAQIDVTKNKLYSITQTSKDQLKSLKKDVYIYIYGYDETNVYVNLIKQYNAFNNKIHYEIVNEATNYEVVNKYGLGNYNAIVVACENRDKTLYPEYEFSSYDYSTGDTIDLTEETITNAILNVSTDNPVKIYFATGSGEYEKSELSYLVSALEAQVYECEDLNLLTITQIPDDCDVLAIMDPQEDLTEGMVNIIKTYIDNGGNLFISALAEENKYPNLQNVLNLYGVKINFGVLYEGSSSNSYAYQNTANIPYILIPDLSASNKVTSDLYEDRVKVILPWSQSLSYIDIEDENVNITKSNILTTSTKCYNITNLNSSFTQEALNQLEASQYVIGSEITRTLTSTNENGEETKNESKLIVYGNTSFYADFYKTGNMQMQPIASMGNASLALNSFAELTEQQNLITVKKSANVTKFESTAAEDRVVKVIIFGVPVLIILAGIIVWNIRKRKR